MIDKKVVFVILVTLFLVIGSFFLSYWVVNRNRNKKGEEPLNLKQFLNNNQKLDFRTVLVGMSFGIVFGFIDNAGLWFGLQSFQKYIPGGLLTKSGWGNTYSDGLGASLGTSVAVILRTLYPIGDTPIWVDTVGIILGCILGIYIPRLLTGKK
jgi:hypothetical protein